MSRPGFAPRADVAERRARVLALRIEQRPYAEIAAELGITASAARVDYQRALEQYAAGQRETAHVARDRELAKLDEMERAVYQVLRRQHITVQHGKIVRDDDGQVVVDDAPVLAAVDRLVRIAARRATLTGMDAPVKVEVSDATDQAIRALAAELAAGVGELEPGREAAAAGDPAGSQVSAPAP
jgi:hypothetical protein